MERIGVVSARRDPWWFNPASAKGLVICIAGLVLLAKPGGDENLLITIAGLLLVLFALVELWFSTVRGRAFNRYLSVTRLLVIAAVGVGAIVLQPKEFMEVFAVGIAIRAIVNLIEALRVPAAERGDRVIRALILLTLAGLCFFLPETVVLGIRAVLGGSAIVLGGILLAAGLREGSKADLLRLDTSTAPVLAQDWLRRRHLDEQRSAELQDVLFFDGDERPSKLQSFWLMVLLSTAIATFAVIQDSTAVVIGAMLVAPLMTPIMGIAASIVNGWPVRVMSSLAMVAAAAAASIALAWMIAAWLPSIGDLAGNSQVVSRVTPSLIDMCIALAAGAAGAWATVDPRVSGSLSGVAIAVALVPPLAVVGITLEAGQTGDALGAFLLFLTNFVSIVLAGGLTFFLAGFAAFPAPAEHRPKLRRVVSAIVLGGAIIIVPLGATSQDLWVNEASQAIVKDSVAVWLGDQSDEFTETVTVDGTSVGVVLRGTGTPPQVSDLQQSLDQQLGSSVDLMVELVPVVDLTKAGDGAEKSGKDSEPVDDPAEPPDGGS